MTEEDKQSTAQRAASLLYRTANTLRERDAVYKGSDALYAETMAVLFPDGVVLADAQDHHRFHIFMLMMVKVTRYARNWEIGHPDSLTDLAAYATMLAALDKDAALNGGGEVQSQVRI